jgi:DUF4097 and DUF4098 domain-containing protein YvlB
MPPPRPRSVAGPLILIVIGILFLLRNFGYTLPLFHDCARYWPLLLVVIGLVRLGEFFYARSTGRPAPRMGGGTVFLLIIVIIVGTSLSAVYHGRDQINWGPLRDNVEVDDNFMHLFGNEYSFDGEVTQPMSTGGTVRVNCDRGNITVNNWDQPQVKVVYRKRIFATSQDEANSTNQATTPRLQAEGSMVDVQANTEGAGPKGVVADMEIFVPQKADLELTERHGDISITQRAGDIKVSSQHGDVTLDQVTGNVNLTTRHGSLKVSNLTGNLMADGRLNDLVLDSITGTALVTADIFGDTRISKLQKGVTIRTSRTELQMARLDGVLTMDSGDMQGDGLLGPVSLATKAKDINLRNLKGDVRISDDHGDINLETGSAAGMGNLDVTTHHGDVHLRLPSKANFQYQVVTRHGEVSSDFENMRAESHAKSSSASGTVGKGGVKVTVTSDTGDIAITKTEESMAAPPEPPVPPANQAVPAPPAKPAIPDRPAKPAKKKIGDVDVL